MNDSSKKKPLFTEEELAGGGAATPGNDPSATAGNDESVNDEQAESEVEGQPGNPELDEAKLQSIADQLQSLDDPAMAAVVRGMADESRQAFCAAVAGTLSDEQLEQCGLSKSASMSGNGDQDGDQTAGTDPDEAQLQDDMAQAKPGISGGGSFMSLTNAAAAGKTKVQPHPHSKELAETKAASWLDRAKAVHSKNSAVITAEQIEGIEAVLQGERCMSLLEKDHGASLGEDMNLLPITTLITMGERMVKGESNADLLKVKTLNMSLTGDDDGKTKPVKITTPGNFDEESAKKEAEERWKKPNATPVMTG